MGTIELDSKDLIICDPCYIKRVASNSELRFDALRTVAVLHDGDDGEYPIELASGIRWLGVDSGRIWIMEAEFPCEVTVDSGLSGNIIVRHGSDDWGKDIKKANHLGENH